MKNIFYLSFAFFFLLSASAESQFLTRGDASTITPQCNANVTTYQLTPAMPSQAGEIWNITPINLRYSFDLQFQIFMGAQPYSVGADGMCFVMQPHSTDSGAGGGGLGYQGMDTSLAIEFDTYENGWDPVYCHTAIEKNGDIDHTDLSGNNLAGPFELSPINATLPDNAWHTAEIIWNAVSDSLSLYFDCSRRVSYRGDIIDSVFKGNPVVYWGFTGGTGADDNSQKVCITSSFTITDSAVNPTCKDNDGKAIINVHGGNSPFTYLWTPSGQTTAAATGLSAGLYTVKIESPGDTCAPQRDTVRLKGSTISVRATDAKCSRLNTGSASINIVNGVSPYTYLWSNGATTQTDTALVSGKYYITVTDNTGCHFTDSVTVVSYPAPTISTSPPSNDSVCYDGNTTISGTGGVSYTWLPAAGLSCANCVSPVASPSVTTIYTVTGTDANGCTNTATITLKVLPLPSPIISGRDTICIGGNTVLTVSGGTSYLWTPGGNASSSYTARPPVTTTYTIQVTKNGCSTDTTVKVTVVPVQRPVIHPSKDSVCQGDTLTLSASGGTLYHWTPGGQTSATIHVTLSNATTYTLYASGGTCEDSATQTIKVIKLLKAAAKATPDTVCPNTLVNIIAAGTGGNVTYSWNTGATTSGIPVRDTVTTTYTVTVHGTCDDTVIPVTVYVVPLPSIKVKGDHFECAGAEDTLTVSSITNPTTYSWSNGETGTRITPIINGAQIYTVTAMNSLGCTVTDTFSVKEQSYPQVSLNYPTACGSGELSIIATASGNGPFTYKWSTGGTYDTVNVYIDNDKTVYTVTVSNGCKVSVADTVIEDNPQMFACCDAKIYLGGDTELVASGLEITNYQWTPANSGLSCYTCPNPIASPSVTTTYTVSGKDSAGCPIERTITITVETPCNNFIVPNVFTPTNAGALGLDNILYIQATNFSSWSLIIYDRWGHEVYKSTDDTKYWNGNTENGSTAPTGVYYYIIKASCVDNSFQKDGFIQLIR